MGEVIQAVALAVALVGVALLFGAPVAMVVGGVAVAFVIEVRG